MAAAANLMVTLFIARSEDTSSTRPGGYSPGLHATGQKRPVGSWKHFLASWSSKWLRKVLSSRLMPDRLAGTMNLQAGLLGSDIRFALCT